ncbi:hypothetical protein DACRYDRAFT_112795, partial [Dacryopinax primogenitus]
MSSPTRVKVITHAPLPLVRVWFEVSTAVLRGATVRDLKEELCQSIPALADGGLSATNITLEIDEFELLDESGVSVIQNEDLLSIKAKSPPHSIGLPKRRREAVDYFPFQAKRRRVDGVFETNPPRLQNSPANTGDVSSSTPSKTTDEDSSSSGDVSEEENEEENESQSTSSTSTQDSSEFSKSTSAAVDVESGALSNISEMAVQLNGPPPHAIQFSPIAHESTRTQTARPVPPGEGKPSTHARNVRRRKRQALLKAGSTITPHEESTPTLAPESLHQGGNEQHLDGLPYDTPPPEPLPVFSAMAALTLPSKLTNKNKRKGFKKSMDGKAGQKIIFGSPSRHHRLIPPSEKGDIPHNMFITSVDCSARETISMEMIDHATILSSSDWDRIEGKFDSYEKVSSLTDLTTGDVVAWQALALNQRTCSPEVMLHLATVVAVSRQEENTCTVSFLQRPEKRSHDEEDDASM